MFGAKLSQKKDLGGSGQEWPTGRYPEPRPIRLYLERPRIYVRKQIYI